MINSHLLYQLSYSGLDSSEKLAADPRLCNARNYWFATESSLAFRAAAESDPRSAPRTPPAPGSWDWPMMLSRSRSLRGLLAVSFDVHPTSRPTRPIPAQLIDRM